MNHTPEQVKDWQEVVHLAGHYYNYNKDSSGWSQGRGSILNRLTELFTKHNMLEGCYQLTSKILFSYTKGCRGFMSRGNQNQFHKEFPKSLAPKVKIIGAK